MAQQLRGKLDTDAAQPGVRLAVTVPMEAEATPRTPTREPRHRQSWWAPAPPCAR